VRPRDGRCGRCHHCAPFGMMRAILHSGTLHIGTGAAWRPARHDPLAATPPARNSIERHVARPIAALHRHRHRARRATAKSPNGIPMIWRQTNWPHNRVAMWHRRPPIETGTTGGVKRQFVLGRDAARTLRGADLVMRDPSAIVGGASGRTGRRTIVETEDVALIERRASTRCRRRG